MATCPRCGSAYCKDHKEYNPHTGRSKRIIRCSDCNYKSDHVVGDSTKWEQLPGQLGKRVNI
ncbi:hypothetical protein M0R04_04740 [Candidatus Dojkabacteria bacterium]|jgi:C4-type Zn-finger protein|nr:hypothetical protein [Candidatus Dojkabacteria bacterium]